MLGEMHDLTMRRTIVWLTLQRVILCRQKNEFIQLYGVKYKGNIMLALLSCN